MRRKRTLLARPRANSVTGQAPVSRRSAVTRQRVATAAAAVGLAALTLTGLATDPAPAHVRITTDINFADDVRPILRRYCMPCHNPKGSAPDYIDLTTYGNDAKPGARAWAVAIEEELLTGRMPPWTADARYDHFRNSRRMSQREIDILVAWVQGGGPQGPRRNLPSPPEFTEEEWVLGVPDLVLEPAGETAVEPGQQTAVQRERLTIELEADAWITGYEFRPQHPGVVYRMAAWVHGPDEALPEQLEVEVQVPYDPFRDEDEPEPTRMRTATARPQFLGQWLRGDDPVLLPDGAGKRLRRGSTIELVVEYRRRPVPRPDRGRGRAVGRERAGRRRGDAQGTPRRAAPERERHAVRTRPPDRTAPRRRRPAGKHGGPGSLPGPARADGALHPRVRPRVPRLLPVRGGRPRTAGDARRTDRVVRRRPGEGSRRPAVCPQRGLRTRRSPRAARDLRAPRAAADPRRHADRSVRRTGCRRRLR